MSPTGVHLGNHFGEIEEALKQLAEACGLRFEGVKDIHYTIVDHE
jgi:hypothetical protein